MRIVIAEDSAIIRAGLAEILADRGHVVVAAVGNAEDLQSAVDEHHPDAAPRRLAAWRVSMYWEKTSTPVPGWSRRMAIAARMPSSV